ncbi:phage terminase large subunit family protein [Megalodesulfovibrio paquesii]
MPCWPRAFDKYTVVRCCMDQTGMGEKPVEDAKDAHGQYRVEGVLFTGPAKQHLATLGKEAFQDRRLRIPQGDTGLRRDLHSLKKIQAPLGAPRFLSQGDADSHADRAWALFPGPLCRRHRSRTLRLPSRAPGGACLQRPST